MASSYSSSIPRPN